MCASLRGGVAPPQNQWAGHHHIRCRRGEWGDGTDSQNQTSAAILPPREGVQDAGIVGGSPLALCEDIHAQYGTGALRLTIRDTQFPGRGIRSRVP